MNECLRSASRWLIAAFLSLGALSCGGARTPRVGTARRPQVPLTALPSNAKMRAHFIDVAQGAATLLEFPCAAVLVDAGGESDDSYDSTAALVAYLDRFFAARPDLHGTIATLFVTHPHIDHDRGVSAVVERYRVQHVVTDGIEAGSGGAEQAALHAWATSHGVPLERVSAVSVPPTGASGPTIDAVACPDVDPDLRVLWGGASSMGGDFGNANNSSVVLRVSVGARSMLITGDLEEAGIAALLARYAAHPELLDTDLYVAGHHGSHNGTTPALVAAMTPEVSVIEMGPESIRERWCAYAFGHPSCAVVDMLAAATTRARPAADVLCGTQHEVFEDRRVTRAVYATGWDGALRATFMGDGSIDVSAQGM